MKRKTLIALISLGIGFSACKKESGDTTLYDGINGEEKEDTTAMLNPASIEGLHQQIFLPKCATSGCHDGHFEPDFRTIQSSYTTLVNAPVFKQVDPFTVRVKPGDKENSWLWERVTTDDPVLGRMPLYSDMLSQEELDNIASWIEGGAKDMFGADPQVPNLNPTLYGYYIGLASDSTVRFDNTRRPMDFTGSMVVPENTELAIYIGVFDDSTNIWELTNNVLKFSTDQDDFSSAVERTAQLVWPLFQPKDYFGPGRDGFFLWKVTINTSQWNKDDVVYLRYYTKDEHHSEPAELPDYYSEWYLKTHFSMVID